MMWYTFGMGRKPLPEADRSTTVGIRLPPSDRDALRALCVMPAWRDHDQSGVLRELLRREARAHGLIPPDPSAPQALLRLAPPDASPPAPAPGASSPAASLPAIPPGFAVILWPLSHALPTPPAAAPGPADQGQPAALAGPSQASPPPAPPTVPPAESPAAPAAEQPAAEQPALPPAPRPVPHTGELQARLAAHMELRPELRQAHVASLAGLQKQDLSRLLTAGRITQEKGAKLWAWLVAEGG
jgi:hypothetical protein